MTAKMPRLSDRELVALKFVRLRKRVYSAMKAAVEELYRVNVQLETIGKSKHPQKERLRARRAELDEIITAYSAQLLCLDNDSRAL